MDRMRRLGAQAATPEAAAGVDFGITEPVVPIAIWEQGGANRYSVAGTLTLNGVPVAGASIVANNYTLPSPTGADGAFVVERDRTVLDRSRIRVKDASAATLDGRALSAEEDAALTAAEAAIETAFVIALDAEPELAVGQQDAGISGVLTFADGSTPVPSIALWGYRLSGTVFDTAGAPQPGVYVSISDDEGETWALSNETVDDGRYALRFFPVPNSPYTVRIARGQDLLASDGELQFQPDTSAALDLVTDDAGGRVAGTGDEGAFEVESQPGAEYVGYLVGLAADDRPVEAITTFPDADGRFTLTLATIQSPAPLSFFQERLRFFSAQEVVPGGEIPGDVIPAELAANSPRNLPPVITPSP